MGILSAISFGIAVRISNRIGPLYTAVFTHIPSSIFLILVPFSPSAAVAAFLLLSRSLLSKMDIPTRKSYMASIIQLNECRMAVSRTSMSKRAGRAVGPIASGYTLANLSAIPPFLLGGILKLYYDLILWSSFKNVQVKD